MSLLVRLPLSSSAAVLINVPSLIRLPSLLSVPLLMIVPSLVSVPSLANVPPTVSVSLLASEPALASVPLSMMLPPRPSEPVLSTDSNAPDASVTVCAVPSRPTLPSAWMVPGANPPSSPPLTVMLSSTTRPPFAAIVPPALLMFESRSSVPFSAASSRPWLLTVLLPVSTTRTPVPSTIPLDPLFRVSLPAPSRPEPLMVLSPLSSVSVAVVPVITWVSTEPKPVLSISEMVPPPDMVALPAIRSAATCPR